MSTWLSENLNERVTVAEGPVRLNGWSLSNTGRQSRFIAFKDGERTRTLIVVPPEGDNSILGLNEPYPEGLAIESLTGDGTLIANVFFEKRELVVVSEADGNHQDHA